MKFCCGESSSGVGVGDVVKPRWNPARETLPVGTQGLWTKKAETALEKEGSEEDTVLILRPSCRNEFHFSITIHIGSDNSQQGTML